MLSHIVSSYFTLEKSNSNYLLVVVPQKVPLILEHSMSNDVHIMSILSQTNNLVRRCVQYFGMESIIEHLQGPTHRACWFHTLNLKFDHLITSYLYTSSYLTKCLYCM
uniref:Uncharacterized protein n=1 Tax=Cacopsylla melanoneura TaxID=428564 RepID=A0A8D8R4H0_9HEMI